MTMPPGNLLTGLPSARETERFIDILRRPGCRIEQIVSHGQVTPVDQPYCQAHDEWVLVLAGAARVEVAGRETALWPGDHLFIPAGASHRVTYTDTGRPTVWLAIHIGETAPDHQG
ncbi:cupin domain-containing protein [Nitrospirillum sp. BR 11163]|uniref:cupin domain-containing protein n=1 Tax=Nitrospirillum sp. BR 11163 TaxID=3104323 RepID=UPI002AFFA388|nr:cupin domain-containing protein [Nitrospirillum sp. BR 11163]MEA1673203.1 cupin domain-containing protein [Nitrospirillum sp. BR 11163]